MRNFIKSLLKWVEKFLRTDIPYLISGGFWLTTAKIFAIFASFLLSIIYARYLTKKVYGDYRYIISIFGTFAFLALPGIGTSLTRSVARGYEASFKQGFKWIFSSSWLISIIGFAISGFFFIKGNAHMASIAAFASVIVPLTEGTGSWKGYLDAKKQFKRKSKILIFQNFLTLIAILAAVFITIKFSTTETQKVMLILGAVILSQAALNLFMARKVFKEIPKKAQQDPENIKYGLHLTITTIPSAVASYLDGILLYAYLGPVSLAVYSFAMLPTSQLKSFLGTAATIAFPKFSEKDEETLKKTLPPKLFKSVLFTFAAVILYIIFAPLIYKIFFPNYVEAVFFSQILALSLVFFPLSLFRTAITASGSVKKVYMQKFFSPLLEIGAFAILIPVFGIWGAIFGRIIGRLSGALISLVLFLW